MSQFQRSVIAIVAAGMSYVCAFGATPFTAGSSSLTPQQAGSQFLPYPYTDETAPKPTSAPSGYEPFHIEHYARHGSRWHIEDIRYTEPVKMLEKADRNGKLTERGKLLLTQLREIRDKAKGKGGELTPLGAEQHRGIGRRLARNYPEIFREGTWVDAKSTVVIRCILSMFNEIAELEKACPQMHVRTDASQSTQEWMGNAATVEEPFKKLYKRGSSRAKAILDKDADYSAFVSKIFTDPKFVDDSIGASKIFKDVFSVAVSTQSHTDQPDLYDVFTADELYREWLVHNAVWYMKAGNTSLTKNIMPYTQRNLLRNIIESADTAMVSPNISANLRFGHDGMVGPMSVLMELNGLDVDVDDFEELALYWRDYALLPMACNIQLIFYRPTGSTNPDDVLVRIALNEDEAKLPIKAVSGPYYKWTDVRNFWMNKLDNFKLSQKKK